MKIFFHSVKTLVIATAMTMVLVAPLAAMLASSPAFDRDFKIVYWTTVAIVMTLFILPELGRMIWRYVVVVRMARMYEFGACFEAAEEAYFQGPSKMTDYWRDAYRRATWKKE